MITGARQYFQQANQVMVSRHLRSFVNPNGGAVTCFGLLTGYPCCTANIQLFQSFGEINLTCV